VLDEPFTALDKANRDRAWDLVYRAHSARKFTILHVTHDEDRARDDGLRIVRIDGGKTETGAAPVGSNAALETPAQSTRGRK
jgi:ABC-type thiamine transport system ATPase subunit